jgi:hypothetical protein
MKTLHNTKIKTTKQSLIQEVINNLESLKFEDIDLRDDTRELDVEEVVRIDRFNYKVDDAKFILRLAYERLYEGVEV